MKIIVGLGNPGLKYKNTFHNVGWMVIDCIAKKYNLKLEKETCSSVICKSVIEGEEVVLAKPQTFMNLSGKAVKELVRKFNVDETKDLIVVYDDVDLKLGLLRLREEGSAGTHNGMRNIVAELNSQNFLRMRVGTKNKALEEKEIALIDFVLSKIEYEDKKVLEVAINRASECIVELIEGKDIQRIQEHLNR